MARKKCEPLTARETFAAKAFNSWQGSRCFVFPSDKQGNPHTTKNLADLVDQYLHENKHIHLDVDVLVTLVRRYRATKGAATRHKRKRRSLRKLAARLNAIGERLKQEARAREQQRKHELASRQKVFEFG